MNLPQWLQWFCIIALILVLVLLVVLYRQKRKQTSLNQTENLARLSGGLYPLCFTKEDINKMKVRPDDRLGEGGFAIVYKGFLDDKDVAVKCMKTKFETLEDKSSKYEMFRNEAFILSKVQHKNIVKLLGYCDKEGCRALVLDFAPNSTLSYHLHGETVLSWENRFKVAVGVASALCYLHHDCHPRIIHRDIKSSNVLLDDKFEAQVADFGLAYDRKDTLRDGDRPKGTFGYTAPEYRDSGTLSAKCDVYSYGIMLLEMITGNKAILKDKELQIKVQPLKQAQQLLGHALRDGDYSDLVDKRLKGAYYKEEMHDMIMVANACTSSIPDERPLMSTVLHLLDKKRTAQFSLEIQHEGSSLCAPQDMQDTFMDLRNIPKEQTESSGSKK